MGLADELQKLDDLRRQGTLSDAEFEQANQVLPGHKHSDSTTDSLTDAGS